MPNLIQPVLANLEAIIQAIVLLVILASGAVRMFRESKEAQQRAERQRGRRPQPGPARKGEAEVAEARGAPPQRQGPQESIRSEVEEFLRRVGQETKEAEPRPQRQPRIEVLEGDSGFDVDQRPRQSRRRPAPGPQARPAPAEVTVPVSEGIDRGETVAEHVAEHMKRGEFDERVSHLGEELSQTDERLEARLHQKFDHGLGNLAARRRVREAEDLVKRDLDQAPKLADNLLDLLSTPQGVQQAVILNEVLSRPTDRW